MADLSTLTWYKRLVLGRPIKYEEHDQMVDNLIEMVAHILALEAIPPGETINLGNILIVRENGVNATAVKGSLSKVWKDPQVAASQAVAGDRIFVVGGSHTVTGNCHVPGVNWHFIGRPLFTITSGAKMFNVTGADTLRVTGDCQFDQNTSSGRVLEVNNASADVEIGSDNTYWHSIIGLMIRRIAGKTVTRGRIKSDSTGNAIDLSGAEDYAHYGSMIENNGSSGFTAPVKINGMTGGRVDIYSQVRRTAGGLATGCAMFFVTTPSSNVEVHFHEELISTSSDTSASVFACPGSVQNGVKVYFHKKLSATAAAGIVVNDGITSTGTEIWVDGDVETNQSSAFILRDNNTQVYHRGDVNAAKSGTAVYGVLSGVVSLSGYSNIRYHHWGRLKNGGTLVTDNGIACDGLAKAVLENSTIVLANTGANCVSGASVGQEVVVYLARTNAAKDTVNVTEKVGTIVQSADVV